MKVFEIFTTRAMIITLLFSFPMVESVMATECSVDQTNRQKAAVAFQKMLSVLRHPRCANCHGAINVYDEATTHPGGPMIDVTEDIFGDKEIVRKNADSCVMCHDEGNGLWIQSSPISEIQWANLSDRELWQRLQKTRIIIDPDSKRTRTSTGALLIGHIAKDHLIDLGFQGKKGIGEDSYVVGFGVGKAAPPPLTKSQFLEALEDWVNAMNARTSWPEGDCSVALEDPAEHDAADAQVFVNAYVIEKIEITKPSYQTVGSVICDVQISKDSRVNDCTHHKDEKILNIQIKHNFRLRAENGNTFVPGENVYLEISGSISGHSKCCSIGDYVEAHFEPKGGNFKTESKSGDGDGFAMKNSDLSFIKQLGIFANLRRGSASMRLTRVATFPDNKGKPVKIVLNGTNGNSLVTYHLKPAGRGVGEGGSGSGGSDGIPMGNPDPTAIDPIKPGKKNLPPKGDEQPIESDQTMELGINYPGYDFKSFLQEEAKPRLCRAACEEHERCQAWTYVKPRSQGNKAKCWLKYRVPEPKKDDCCVSGVSEATVQGRADALVAAKTCSSVDLKSGKEWKFAQNFGYGSYFEHSGHLCQEGGESAYKIEGKKLLRFSCQKGWQSCARKNSADGELIYPAEDYKWEKRWFKKLKIKWHRMSPRDLYIEKK